MTSEKKKKQISTPKFSLRNRKKQEQGNKQPPTPLVRHRREEEETDEAVIELWLHPC
jgi:hypothetical protein